MKRTRLALAVLLCLACLLGPALPAAAGGRAVPPLAGPVVRGFDPPDQRWLAGHRGVDLLGPPESRVVAALAGRVVFAGTLAGRGVVVVSHGELRTTYLPVQAVVSVGATVATGETIGRLSPGHACPGGMCLHWGLKRGDTYLDPLSLLGDEPLRLLPAAAAPAVGRVVGHRAAALDAGRRLPGLLTRPVPGPVTSGFGLRRHPIFGDLRPHNGVDLSAACGTPILAAASGRVVRVGYDEASGNRLELDHGLAGGHTLRTGYLHATGYRVRTGQLVRRGELVGWVGSTGWSTGCHLHLAVWLDSRPIDPERFLGP